MHDLIQLAELIKQRNLAEIEITQLTGRPAAIGHLGEYIASKVFFIDLARSAAQKAIDGHFTQGPLTGQSVNIKWYAKQEGLLDITPAALPDIYLVLSGPKSNLESSRGAVRPWIIAQVVCFEAAVLVSQLTLRGAKLGTATSVPQEYWTSNEVYPRPNNSKLHLTDDQRQLLAMFA